jgi:acyl dehydratase
MKFEPSLAPFKHAKQNRIRMPPRESNLIIAQSYTMAHQCVVVLVIMKERYFDDLRVGDRFKSEPLSMTEKDLIEFAHKFDPQMFHLSRRDAERTIFKGLIASGWHTAAMTMRLFVRTLNFAEGAIGLGVDELRWPNAVRPGDVLTVETEILELRPSRSRPGHGIIRLRNVTTNQRGEVVQTMLASAMVPRRTSEQQPLTVKQAAKRESRI